MTDRENVQLPPFIDGERLRHLVERVREYAIYQLDPLGHVISWNAGAARMKGYRENEVLGKHFSLFYDRKDVESGRPARNMNEAAQYGESRDEGWRIRKDGSKFWASVVITALQDTKRNVLGFIKITRDMTERHEREVILKEEKDRLAINNEQRAAVLVRVNYELREEIAERKRVEEELKKSLEQLRALADRLRVVREDERTLVAREMHDELGQACTAIKMDLASIGRKATKKQTQLRAKVDSATQLVDTMIATVRRIASELRPRTLDDLGLNAALEWQAHEFETRTGIRCRVTLPEEQLALDAGRSTAVFRIFQESLTNVARHAEATQVDARLERHSDQLIFIVHDNGKGFDPGHSSARRSLGLVGMQERALLLDGELEIDGGLGSGATMTLRIPLPRGIELDKEP